MSVFDTVIIFYNIIFDIFIYSRIFATGRTWSRGFTDSFSALQIKAGQGSITANLQSLTAEIYYVMIIGTSGFSEQI